MKEQEFDERIAEIKKDINLLYNHPLVHLHKKDPNQGVIPYDTQVKRLLESLAANVEKIEEGIKKYNRPKDWALVQEGILTNGD